MRHVEITRDGKLAWVTLDRGKVNALNEPTVQELTARFDELRNLPTVEAVAFTGKGKFFSFGFDVPELFDYSKQAFMRFLTAFTRLYTGIYAFPKPVIAALNGHTVAGGCMLATACDYRIMARGKGRISLNEVTFGASVFAGSVEMLRGCAGQRNAEKILYSGSMYDADEAVHLGLVDEATAESELAAVARDRALGLAAGDPVAFASIKSLLRGPTAELMRRREADSVREFADIWYSEATRQRLKRIEIRR